MSDLESFMLLAAPLLLAWALISQTTSKPFTAAITDQRALIAYLFGIILMLAYTTVNYRAFLLVIDLLRGKIIVINVPAQLWGRYLILGDYRFVLEESNLSLIKPGVTYRACLLPYSHT